MQPIKPDSSRKNQKNSRGNEELAKLEPKTQLGNPGPPKQPVKFAQVTDEQIAKRAFEIWNDNGRPSGRDLENWLQAERELRKLN